MSGDAGRLGIGIIAAALTWWAGGSGAAIAFAFSAGSLIGGLIFPPESQRIEGQRLDDLTIMSSTRGAPMPMVWGSFRVAGNLMHGKKHEVQTEQQQGGKGMGGGVTTVSWSYFADMAVTLCDCFRTGPITGVRRIWLNNKLFYDNSEGASADAQAASADNAQFFKVYTGTASQLPDPTLEAIHGAGNVPPYAYTAYIVFTRIPLMNYGNGIPQVSCEVVRGPPAAPAPAITFSAFPGRTAIDPDTGYLWVYNGDSNVRVWDTGSLTLLHTIPITGFVPSSIGADSIVYHPPSRTFWIAKGAAGPGNEVARFSADSYTELLAVDVSPNLGYHPETFAFDAASNTVYLAGFGGAQSGLTFSIPGTLTPITPLLEGGTTPSAVWGDAGGGYLALCKASPSYEMMMIPIPNTEIVTSYTTLTFPDTTGGSGAVGRVFYDAVRSCFWWTWGTGRICKVAIPGLAITTLVTLPENIFDTTLGSDGRLYAVNGDGVETIYIVNLDTGGFSSVDNAFVTGSYAQGNIQAYGTYLVKDGNIKVPLGGGLLQTPVALSTIVADLCAEAGLLSGDINVSELTDLVFGYAPPAPFVVADAISALRSGYIFDVREEDWKLTFPKRGKSSLVTIDSAELLPPQEPDQSFSVTVQQEIDLPALISVGYFDPALEYEQGNQVSRKIVTSSQNTVSIQLPVAMTADKAAQLSDVLRDNAWVERHRYGFALPPKYAALSPADVITVTVQGNSHVMRLTKVDRGGDGRLACEGGRDQVSVYTSARLATPTSFVPQVLESIPLTRLALLDIPILRQADNDLGYYAAASPANTNTWPGAALFESRDGGASYPMVARMAFPAAIGTATTALPTGPATIWDEGSSVTVSLLAGATLASDSEVNVLAGANAAALGAAGRWEILSWRTATLNIDGTYTLSRLIRGRLGSDWAIGLHQAGDTFVALTPAGLVRVGDTLASLNQSYLFKAVTVGKTLASATAQSFTDTGAGLRPYSPCHLNAVNNGGGTYGLTWVRRTRIDGEWLDYVDVPLWEDHEEYLVQVYAGATLLSSQNVTSPAATITASAGNTAKVAQLSARVGPGYFSTITL